MNARSVNAAAGVVQAAVEQGRQTAAGIALALDSAGLLMSPEMATEAAELGQQVDRLDHLDRITLPELRREIEHHKDGKARWRKRAEAAEARVAELELERHSTNEALADVTVALIAPADEREAARRSVDRAFPAVAEFLTDGVTRLNVPLQALREDLHDGPLHHSYQVGRDLPESGGAQ